MRKHQIQSYLSPVVCLLVSFVLGSAVLAVSGYSPMTAYQALLVNALGTKNGILQTLLKASPLIFCGLSAAVALRAGVFNIGIEGQLYIGAFAGFLAGRYLTGLPPWLHIPLCILTGALAGALYALIPAILKQRTGAHEVVTTIMLNYVAVLFTSYLSNHSFKAEGMMPQTELVQASARISRIVPQSQLTWAIVAAVVFLAGAQFFLYHTPKGYELESVGANAAAAEAGGISIGRLQMQAMLLSGAIAGIGGTMEVLGTHGRFIQDFASGAGYQGVSIAILGGNSPVGVGLASLLFGVLQYGGTAMSRTTGVPAEFTEVIQALVVLCVSAPVLVQVLFREGGERKGERS
jgi:simple sugar transport system permease protein